DQIVVARVHTDDLTGINLFAGRHEQHAPFLQIEQGIGVSQTRVLDDEYAVGSTFEWTHVRAIVIKHVVEDAGSACVGKKLRAISDQAARWNDVFHPDPADPLGAHVLHAPAAPAELGHHRARVLLIDIDDQFLVRLEQRDGAVGSYLLLEYDLWL